jgi:hypothetical protein
MWKKERKKKNEKEDGEKRFCTRGLGISKQKLVLGGQ